jgi:succinate dehydrogenase / fumarate reductase cytochrome b subunit|tara:strand:+ start:38 stop:700 length:663 start_codon:yes stop_codon:yes gene_type:complete
MMQNFISTSIGKKVAMAISAIFLMVFLLQHFLINITSVFSEEIFNMLSHFMGTNPLVQFILQPVLIAGVIFHFVMGFYLEIQNRRASKYEYFKERGGANSTWMSRNMIWSGLVILSFLVLHFIDFWIPEMNHKYVEFLPDDPNRYHHELVEKFQDPYKVVFYCFSFVLLSLHLLHGFSSSLKSMGANKSYASSVKNVSYAYSIGIPLGFCFIAIFHHFSH